MTPAERIAYLEAKPTLSVAEAAELGGLSTATIRRAIDNKTLDCTRVGDRILIPTSGLLALIGAAPGGDAA